MVSYKNIKNGFKYTNFVVLQMNFLFAKDAKKTKIDCCNTKNFDESNRNRDQIKNECKQLREEIKNLGGTPSESEEGIDDYNKLEAIKKKLAEEKNKKYGEKRTNLLNECFRLRDKIRDNNGICGDNINASLSIEELTNLKSKLEDEYNKLTNSDGDPGKPRIPGQKPPMGNSGNPGNGDQGNQDLLAKYNELYNSMEGYILKQEDEPHVPQEDNINNNNKYLLVEKVNQEQKVFTLQQALYLYLKQLEGNGLDKDKFSKISNGFYKDKSIFNVNKFDGYNFLNDKNSIKGFITFLENKFFGDICDKMNNYCNVYITVDQQERQLVEDKQFIFRSFIELFSGSEEYNKDLITNDGELAECLNENKEAFNSKVLEGTNLSTFNKDMFKAFKYYIHKKYLSVKGEDEKIQKVDNNDDNNNRDSNDSDNEGENDNQNGKLVIEKEE